MFDIIIKGGTLPDGRVTDIGIAGDRITAIGTLDAEAGEVIDASGDLVSPPFVDPHFHMDATLSYGIPRINKSGTLLEGIGLWGSYIDLQLVAFPQDGLYRDPTAFENTIRALDMGVDVVGGIPHFERTMADGARSVTALCEIAAERGLMVDMHCDETDDPHSRHIETLAYETQRLGLQGRVAGSHLTSMHSMDNYYVSKLLPLMAEAEVAAIPNPLINIMLQGRHDTFPKRRGLTRVKEMQAHGIPVGWGQDCVMDPWYSMGTGDMLDVAFMGQHVAQMTSPEEMRRCFRHGHQCECPDHGAGGLRPARSARPPRWWCWTRATRFGAGIPRMGAQRTGHQDRVNPVPVEPRLSRHPHPV